MRINKHKTVQLGELVVATFDKAAQCSTNPREVSRLAVSALRRMLRRTRGGLRFLDHEQQRAPERVLSVGGGRAGAMTVGEEHRGD